MSKVRSTYAGFVGHEGVPVLLREGEEFDADHSLVVARPELFTAPEPEPKRPSTRAPRGKAKAAEDG